MTYPPRNPRGIMFSAPMIDALTDGRKTQTRRMSSSPLRHARPGDSLWVRETHAYVGTTDPGWLVYRQSYEADCRRHGFDEPFPDPRSIRWTPSLLMRRTASRLTLFVEDVRFETLHSISRTDAIAEGLQQRVAGFVPAYRGADNLEWRMFADSAYRDLWQSLHPETRPVRDPTTKRIVGHEPNPARWDANPELLVITFAVAHRNIDQEPRL